MIGRTRFPALHSEIDRHACYLTGENSFRGLKLRSGGTLERFSPFFVIPNPPPTYTNETRCHLFFFCGSQPPPVNVQQAASSHTIVFFNKPPYAVKSPLAAEAWLLRNSQLPSMASPPLITTVDHVDSEEQLITSGVPQGSVLGPLLSIV